MKILKYQLQCQEILLLLSDLLSCFLSIIMLALLLQLISQQTLNSLVFFKSLVSSSIRRYQIYQILSFSNKEMSNKQNILNEQNRTKVITHLTISSSSPSSIQQQRRFLQAVRVSSIEFFELLKIVKVFQQLLRVIFQSKVKLLD